MPGWPCRAQSAWNIHGLADNKVRQRPMAVAKCVELRHGGPMHMLPAACQFITLSLWHGVVKPILGVPVPATAPLPNFRITGTGVGHLTDAAGFWCSGRADMIPARLRTWVRQRGLPPGSPVQGPRLPPLWKSSVPGAMFPALPRLWSNMRCTTMKASVGVLALPCLEVLGCA